MTLQGDITNPDAETLDALTKDGPLAAGALPALDVGQAEGTKHVWQSTAGGGVSKIKPPPKGMLLRRVQKLLPNLPLSRGLIYVCSGC